MGKVDGLSVGGSHTYSTLNRIEDAGNLKDDRTIGKVDGLSVGGSHIY